jgi:hypothetical protein
MRRKRLTADLAQVTRRLSDEQVRLALAHRFSMEKLRAYCESAIVELQDQKTNVEQQLSLIPDSTAPAGQEATGSNIGEVRTQLVDDKCGGLIKSQTHFSLMR